MYRLTRLLFVLLLPATFATPQVRGAEGFLGDLDRVLPSIGVTRQGTTIDAVLRPELSLDDPRPRLLYVYAPATEPHLLAVSEPLINEVADDPKSPRALLYLNPDGNDGQPTNGSGGNPMRGYPPKDGYYDSPTDPESRYVWRWIGMYGPDLVVEVVYGEGETWFVPESNLPQLAELAKHLPGAKPFPPSDELVPQLVKVPPGNIGLVPAVRVVTNSMQYAATLDAALAKMKLPPSPARRELQQRAARSAKQIVGQLLDVYGKKLDAVAYIPALALIGRLRQDRINQGEKVPPSPIVLQAIEPYVTGKKKTVDGKGGGSTYSGHLVFGELAATTGEKYYTELVLNAANLAFDENGKPREAMPSHNEMSDAVFMGCPILAQASHLTGDEKYATACLQNLRFMEKLCLRKDGLYRHSPLDEAAWGRGNGFPALGLSWSIGELSESFAGRNDLIEAHRKHLQALLKHQDATGCWHQVIDHPESYREFTATAMITYAMMHGVRRGWLDAKTYAPAIESAWNALKLRIAADGSLVDVCTGTGKQKSLRDYYDRPAILGRDDRGGAMALMVATERQRYEAAKAATK
jgi:unsaturated rhamnogalacturonyl hydrolase